MISKNVNLSTEFMPGMTTDRGRTSLEVSFAEMKFCKKLKYKKIIIYMLGIRVNPLALTYTAIS